MSDEVQTTPPPSAGGDTTLTFGHTSTARSILGITLLNFLLNIVTLTLWRFWARTKVRRHLWSHTTVNGEPLEYTGTGWELFKSFLVVIFVIILPFYLLVLGLAFLSSAVPLVSILLVPVIIVGYIGLYWLFGMAFYLAQRYRLSRTTWRGVRFGLPGSAKGYGWAFLGYLLLTMITLGWFGPAMEMRLARRFWGQAVYGDKAFGFSAPEGDGGSLTKGLYGPFALAWFGVIIGYVVFAGMLVGAGAASGPTPGVEFILTIYGALFLFIAIVTIFSLLYYAAVIRRIASCITIDGVRFKHNASALGLFWLYFGNALIVIFTLGIGLPFTHVRIMRFMTHRLEAEGTLDTSTINQNPDAGPKMGEGLADAFDLGMI